jgi:hypothetical protein
MAVAILIKVHGIWKLVAMGSGGMIPLMLLLNDDESWTACAARIVGYAG